MIVLFKIKTKSEKNIKIIANSSLMQRQYTEGFRLGEVRRGEYEYTFVFWLLFHILGFLK